MKRLVIFSFLVVIVDSTSSNFTEHTSSELAASEHAITTVKITTERKQEISRVENECPRFRNVYLTQSELFKRLINPCRYDKIQRPPRFDEDGNVIPVDVFIRTYVFYMQNLDTHNLQFTLQMRFQVRYQDPRLIFSKVLSNRTAAIVGEEDLKQKLWIPHVFFVNEKSSGILGTQNRDIITTINADGTVIISSRIHVSLYCSMEFKKFPFDEQRCKTVIGSWIYNASDVKLHWEPKTPFTLGPDKILTEYTSMNISLVETEIDALSAGLQYGDFVGNYSSLAFLITLDRSIGYYLLDYYFPSIMLVTISWVSFWLQADQTAPRAMLGTTSMLTFITLSTSQTKALPKVSYMKVSEIWFMGCALFIFGSLIEFAFVNLLWRRKKHVVLEEVTTVNILKQTLTPTMMRKNYSSSDSSMKKSNSDTSLNYPEKETPAPKMNYNHRLSVASNHSYLPVTCVESMDDINRDKGHVVLPISRKKSHNHSHNEKHKKKTMMTHQEVAILLDKRARFVFPCAFLIFNIFYWILVNV